MKRMFGLLFLSTAVVVGLSITAAAQETIKFTGGTESSFSGLGTGLYSGTLNGTPTSFICDDALDTIHSGDVWNANLWTLSNVATAGNGAFAGSPYALATYANGAPGHTYTVQEVYNAVAYLANILFSHSNADINGIQYAIWGLTDSPAGTPPASAAGWITTALANDNYTNPSIVFYSPDGNLITAGPDIGKTPQEFIGQTPEPVSMVLMGTFLALAGLLLGRKRMLA